MVDANLLVRNYLLSQSSVTTLLGTNANGSIYASSSIPENVDAAKGPFIQLFRSGGKSHEEILPVTIPRMQIRVWAAAGKNRVAANLYGAVHDVLHGANNIVTAAGVIMSALEALGPQEMPADEDTKWVSVNSFYEIKARPN